MKKTTYLIIISFLIMNYSKAQKISFGITTGAAFASYKSKFESVSVKSKTKVGFTAGVASAITAGKYFSFQPQLNFIQKGGRQKEEGTTDKITLSYVELPLNFVFNTNSTNGKFFAGAGPCFSWGFSGKEKYEGGGNSETFDIKFGFDDDHHLRPLEIGVNFLAGYQLKKGLFIAANYNAVLNNIRNNFFDDNIKYHNRYFAVRIGYMFGGNKK
jgi:hypothetical protein